MVVIGYLIGRRYGRGGIFLFNGCVELYISLIYYGIMFFNVSSMIVMFLK